MKEITGYLIDRTTGVGVSGKAVTFKDLAGVAIAAGTAVSTGTPAGASYAQSVSAVTDGNGKFAAWFELSPGPVNTVVTVSGSEIKTRKADEKAPFGIQWAADTSRVIQALPSGVSRGFLNELAVSNPAGHTIRIATGGAVFGGGVFTIENGNLDIPGSSYTGTPGWSRIDIVTLRQYKESAAGQLSGQQRVVVTEGTGALAPTAPATPTGADFTDLLLAQLSTAHGAGSKTVTDRRVFSNPSSSDKAQLTTSLRGSGSVSVTTSYTTLQSIVVSGLSPNVVYDGEVLLQYEASTDSGGPGAIVLQDITSPYHVGGIAADVLLGGVIPSSVNVPGSNIYHTNPLVGISGVSGFTYDIRLKRSSLGASPVYLNYWNHYIILRPRV